MEQIKSFLGTSLGLFLVHLFIMFLVILNANYVLLIHEREIGNQSLSNQNIQILATIEDYRAGINYRSTDLFRDKNIKNLGFKNKGEVVIDTNFVEPTLTQNFERKNYIPNTESIFENNLQKWYQCLFVPPRTEHSANYCRQ